MTIYNISYTVTRSDPFADSFDVWAKGGSAPQWAGDGIFVGNFAIQPWQASISGVWTPPANGVWYLAAIAKALGESSRLGQI